MRAPTFAIRIASVAAGIVLLSGCAHAPALEGRAAPTAAAVEHTPAATTTTDSMPDSAQVVAMLAGMKNAACPLPGVTTGGQPDSLQLVALGRSGYRTVLDLRAATEPRGMDEPAVARASGLAYRNLPVTPETLTDSTFAAFRSLAADSASHPILVHCASGNRVGAVMIPWLVLDHGWSIERAVATANAGGLSSAEMRDQALDYVRRNAPHAR